MEKAAIYEKLGEHFKAWNIYTCLIDKYPADYRAYEKCWVMKPYLGNSKMYKSMINLCPEKEREYKYHYDLLIQKEKEAAIAAELKREKYTAEMKKSESKGKALLFLMLTVIFIFPTISFTNLLVKNIILFCTIDYITLTFLSLLIITVIAFLIAGIVSFMKVIKNNTRKLISCFSFIMVTLLGALFTGSFNNITYDVGIYYQSIKINEDALTFAIVLAILILIFLIIGIVGIAYRKKDKKVNHNIQF